MNKQNVLIAHSYVQIVKPWKQNNINRYNSALEYIKNGNIKIAKNYGCGYFENPIPKGAIYGRIGKTSTYFYVDDFKQFLDPTRQIFDVWVLDTAMHNTFKKYLLFRRSCATMVIFLFLYKNRLFTEKIEPNLYRTKKQAPKEKRAQGSTQQGYTYNVPYRHRRVLEWETTYCTETDAIPHPVYYIEKSRNNKIREQQKTIDESRQKASIEYHILKNKRYVEI